MVPDQVRERTLPQQVVRLCEDEDGWLGGSRFDEPRDWIGLTA